LNAFHVLYVIGLALSIGLIFAESFSDRYEMERPNFCHAMIWKTIMFHY